MRALTLVCQHVATCWSRWIATQFQMIISRATSPFLLCFKSHKGGTNDSFHNHSEIMSLSCKEMQICKCKIGPKTGQEEGAEKGILYFHHFWNRLDAIQRSITQFHRMCSFHNRGIIGFGFRRWVRMQKNCTIWTWCQNAAPWHYATSC